MSCSMLSYCIRSRSACQIHGEMEHRKAVSPSHRLAQTMRTNTDLSFFHCPPSQRDRGPLVVTLLGLTHQGMTCMMTYLTRGLCLWGCGLQYCIDALHCYVHPLGSFPVYRVLVRMSRTIMFPSSLVRLTQAITDLTSRCCIDYQGLSTHRLGDATTLHILDHALQVGNSGEWMHL